MGRRAHDQARRRIHRRIHAPEGKQMGHAGAIVSGGKGTAQDKKIALEAAGIPVGRTPGQTADLMRKVLAERSLV